MSGQLTALLNASREDGQIYRTGKGRKDDKEKGKMI